MYELEKTIKEIKSRGGLTREESVNYFREYKEDKDNGIDISKSRARTILISTNTGLIDFVVSKMNLYSYHDEIYSAGTIGLVNAVDSFDVSKDCQFSTYAVKCIRNQIIAYLKVEDKHYKQQAITISLNDELEYTNRRNKVLVEEIIESDEDVESEVLEDIVKEQNYRYLMQKIEHLKPLQQFVIVKALGLFGRKKLTQQQIADKLNMHRQYITHTLSDSKKLLKILLSDYDELSLNEKIIYTDTMAETYNVNFKDLSSIRNYYSYSYIKDELFILVHQIEDKYGREYLMSLFKLLRKEEAYIIISNFGLFGNPRKSAEEMCEELGLKLNTVHDYISKSKRKFKKILKSVLNNTELEVNSRV